jgi:hypothetical protein
MRKQIPPEIIGGGMFIQPGIDVAGDPYREFIKYRSGDVSVKQPDTDELNRSGLNEGDFKER